MNRAQHLQKLYARVFLCIKAEPVYPVAPPDAFSNASARLAESAYGSNSRTDP